MSSNCVSDEIIIGASLSEPHIDRDMLMCVIYNCMHSTEQQRRLELLMSAVKIIDEDRLVNAQTHDIKTDSAY